jgi:hypothetical protein
VLDETQFDIAVNNAHRVKLLQRNIVKSFSSGWVPPGILSYVVAYDGPAQMATAKSWLTNIERRHGLNNQPLPIVGGQRAHVLSESLEGVICLGRGSILFDNVPISPIPDKLRAADPTAKWVTISGQDGNLLWLFLHLTAATAGLYAAWANLTPYLARHNFNSVFSD